MQCNIILSQYGNCQLDVVSLTLYLFPKKEYANEYPALVTELKWNKNAQTALNQIKEKQYPQSLLQYTGQILLIGINYDKKTKEHSCKIERFERVLQ